MWEEIETEFEIKNAIAEVLIAPTAHAPWSLGTITAPTSS